jgi:hypothetical protein
LTRSGQAGGQDGTSVTAVTDPENDLCVKLYSGLVFVNDICSVVGPQGPQGSRARRAKPAHRGRSGPAGR